MIYSFSDLLFSKSCWHNQKEPNHQQDITSEEGRTDTLVQAAPTTYYLEMPDL